MVVFVVFVGGFIFQKTQNVLGSSFQPVQASQFTLSGAGITNVQTTIQLTSFKLPDPSKTPITMSMFGSIGYAVIEPQTSKIENVSFTGVTQNANGSATLTGVSRGLSFYSPYNASSTLGLSHAGGAYIILTNSGAFYGKQFAFVNSPSYITEYWQFTNPPVFTNAATTTSQAASVAYVNSVAFGSTFVLKALGGTGATGFGTGGFLFDSGAGTALSGTTTPTFTAITATSSSATNYFAGPILSVGANSFTGASTFSGNNNFTQTNTFATTVMSTTTVTDLRNNRGVPYGGKLGTMLTPVTFGPSDTSTTTIFSFGLPGYFISTSSIVHIKLYITGGGFQAGAFRIALNYGGVGKAYKSISLTAGTTLGGGYIDAVLMGNGSTGSQYGIVSIIGEPAAIGHPISGIGGESPGTYAIDSTVNQTVSISASYGTSDGSNSMTIDGGYAEIIN